jgi:hypothetical protein
MAINLPIVSTFDGKGVTGAIGGIQNLAGKLLGLGAIVAGAFAVRAIVDFGRESIEAAQAVEVANKRLEAVAKATQVFGAETGKVTDRLIEFAEAQEMVIATDAEVIKGVQAQLLSFKQLSESADEVGGVFDRVTKAAFDMAAAGFGSAESNAIALGKAFEDPIRGLTALRRSGTVFTEEQQNLIRTLVESGDLLGAQTVILEELETQYGGTAEATATWSDRLQLAFDNVKEAAGESLLPVFERFAQYLVEDVLPKITKFFEEDFPPLLQKFEDAWIAMEPTFAGIGDAIRDMLDLPEDTSILEGILDKIAALEANEEFQEFLDNVVAAFEKWWPEVEKLLPLMLEIAEQILPLMIELLPLLIPMIASLVLIFGNLFLKIVDVAREWGAVSEGAPDWTRAIVAVSPLLTAFIKMWQNLAAAIKSAYDWWTKWNNSGAGRQSGTNRFGGLSGGRAMGGPVTSGSMYAVGERGPELFIPNENGTIVPNNAIGGSTYNITVNAGMGADPVRVGEYVVSAIKRYERASGKVFASA